VLASVVVGQLFSYPLATFTARREVARKAAVGILRSILDLPTILVILLALGMRSVVGVAIGAYREKDIVPMLKKLIECDEIRMETSSRRKDFMRRHLYKADGRASRGLAELLARAMWGGGVRDNSRLRLAWKRQGAIMLMRVRCLGENYFREGPFRKHV
jgi:hypothetical protein